MSNPPPAIATAWTRTAWRDEDAWASVNGAVRAIVSAARSRLIYLGSAEDDFNLLNAPQPRVLPTPENPGPNQGGHRFWLGPQSRWGWPPPREWEYSAARGVQADGDALVVHHEHFDPAYPEIVRDYRWEGPQLRCTASWEGGPTPWFGIHIIPVDVPFSVRPRLVRSPTAPTGMVNARMIGEPSPVVLPNPAVQRSDDHATVTSGRVDAKLGFAPQSFTVERLRGWTLCLSPGPHAGAACSYPDSGYTSQVWVGGPLHSLAELEQLSPSLRPDENGRCASTVWLAAIPPQA